jgi:peptidoglycan/LPS O-acetylase OafA/YrhL
LCYTVATDDYFLEQCGLMMINIQRKRVSDNLDLIRGLAAVAVLIYHVRYRFFFDYANVTAPDWFARGYYALTAFGHDAVMIFFVLSGYFISASVFRDEAAQRWSTKRYAVNRATRLYLVLLPGLLLTAFWDRLGLEIFPDNPVYSGEPRPWSHDFFPVADRLTSETFVANACFLQMTSPPHLESDGSLSPPFGSRPPLFRPFGSNEPLWSLSFEFWYYVLFPLAWFALVRPAGLRQSIVRLALFGVLLVALGKNIALDFPIWLLGTGVCLLPQIRWLKGKHSPLTTGIALALFGGVMAATHVGAVKRLLFNSELLVDYVLGISFALLLYFLLHNQAAGGRGRYATVSKTLASFSYTLYVVHMPVLVFLRASLLPDAPWSPDPLHVGFGVVIALGCIAYAYAISRVTEAKTDLVRDKVLTWLARPEAKESCSPQSLKPCAEDNKVPGS